MAVVGGPLTGTAGDDFVLGDALVLSMGVDNYGNSGTFALKGLGGNDIIVGDVYDALSYDTEGDEIFGGAGDDRIYGDTAPDLTSFGITSEWDGDPLWDTRPEGSGDEISGGGGNDIIFGGAGFDTIHGDAGLDTIHGQADTDYLYGDAGRDTIKGGGGSDQVYGGADADNIQGGDGDDGLYGEAFGTSAGDSGDNIHGGNGDDDIRGGAGGDVLNGGDGDDRIYGGDLSSTASNDGRDSCYGGDGDDEIHGNFGNDDLFGQAGADYLTGGDGNDRFRYFEVTDSRGTAIDTIADFNAASADRIELSNIDAIPGGDDDAFIFRGDRAFTGAGQVRFVIDNANSVTLIKVNTDADTAAEMTIKLSGIKTLDLADFIL